jgi:hypothetical protein
MADFEWRTGRLRRAATAWPEPRVNCDLLDRAARPVAFRGAGAINDRPGPPLSNSGPELGQRRVRTPVTHISHSINPDNRLVVEVPLGCGFHHHRKLVEAALRQPAPPRQRQRQRKPTLVSVARAARKAGIDPARIEIRPDGTVVVTGKGDEPQPSTVLDQWIAKHARAPERH